MDKSVTITANATQEMNKLLIKRGTPNAYIRFGVRGGACAGYAYIFEFADEKRDNDIILSKNNVNVIIDPKSLQLLTGTIVDFEQGIRGHGFQFNNPNVRRNCGCGDSFSI